MRLIIILLLISIFPMHAKFEHQFGGTLSSFSGMGLNYKYKLSRRWHINLNGFIYYYGEEIPDKSNTYSNIGTQLEYNILENSKRRLYALYGFSYWDLRNNDYELRRINDITERIINNRKDQLLNHGLGLGYEIIIKRQVSIAFNLAFQIQNSERNCSPTFINYRSNNENYIGPGFGITIRYIFD